VCGHRSELSSLAHEYRTDRWSARIGSLCRKEFIDMIENETPPLAPRAPTSFQHLHASLNEALTEANLAYEFNANSCSYSCLNAILDAQQIFAMLLPRIADRLALWPDTEGPREIVSACDLLGSAERDRVI
jgi:hypothetical protein